MSIINLNFNHNIYIILKVIYLLLINYTIKVEVFLYDENKYVIT